EKSLARRFGCQAVNKSNFVEDLRPRTIVDIPDRHAGVGNSTLFASSASSLLRRDPANTGDRIFLPGSPLPFPPCAFGPTFTRPPSTGGFIVVEPRCV